jgi:hypothetical protein
MKLFNQELVIVLPIVASAFICCISPVAATEQAGGGLRGIDVVEDTREEVGGGGGGGGAHSDHDGPDHHPRRQLLPTFKAQHVFSLHDPRTVVQKNFQVPKGIVESDKAFRTALQEDEMPRPLNILSFGTSQTFGTGLEDRRYAYPYLISPDAAHVDNLALPATAADHPSLCLQSMIPDADEKNYDLITFEYPSNQSDGIRLLVKRLRERYPKAIIMFTHVWHFIGRARNDKGMTPGQVGLDPTVQWVWKEGDTFSSGSASSNDCPREVCFLHQMMDILDEADGVAYLMDSQPSPQEVLDQGWFGADWHHLKQKGHQNVAVGIANMLKEDQKLWDQAFLDNKPLGSWSLGDQCFNWYYSGKINAAKVQYDAGAKYVCQNQYQGTADCSLEIDPQQGGTVTFQSDFDRPVPVAIGYLTRGFPDTFPTVTVRLNGEDPYTVNPDLDRTTRVNPNSGAVVTSYIQVGYAQPGARNTLNIAPVEVTDLPFQLIGIYMCGACKEFQNGHLGIGVLNMDNNGEIQRFDKNIMKESMHYPGN